MKTTLRDGEQVAKEGVANLQKDRETVGGRLYLTPHRIIFEAHRMNVQGGTTEIELSRVRSSIPCWTKFMGVFPVAPNSLAVATTDAEYRFVLFGRKAWAAAIEAQRNKVR
jgi:hypothetical protein